MRQLRISKQVTNRDTASLETYLQDIGKVDLLTPEEEVELARKIHEGDIGALNRLINANLRFVVSVSKQYQNQGLTLSDLINEGNMGLVIAAKRFDETRGFKFISYAVWWIRQSILQAVAEQSRIVRLPLNKVGSLNKINKTSARLEQMLEREPSAEEIAAELKIIPEDVRLLLKNYGRHISMDAPATHEEDSNLYDLIPNYNEDSPDSALLTASLSKEIERAMQTLSPREGEVIRLFYGLCGQNALNLEEISDEIGLTPERIRQIKEKAVRKLKSSAKNKNLKMYLG
ncbi:MAG: sigma-70 family RNA polymerase sigma factor [Bacteroidia bacterium]|nr:sigma-70 family RNA polymerase sigma factor [Bacteroidia bacterium]